MQRSMFIAATGMEAQRLNIDVISNNLANVNTTGFKKSRADFQELLYQGLKTAGAASAEGTEIPAGIQVGLGVKPAAVQKMFQQGDFINTGNSLDLVIEGRGFFQIAMPDGEIAYTRSGAFKLDSEGQIVNSDGYPMEPSVLAQFINPGGLSAIGKNLFITTGASGEATTGNAGTDGFGTINQGFLENSNVNVVEEMVNMIVSQRAYELNSKAIQTSDEMLAMINNLKR
jgi:flagellar basal-body rod protein FlgG